MVNRHNETRRLVRLTALAACCLALLGVAAAPVHAAALTWGTSGTGGSGTWTATDGWWNGTTQQTWSNATPDDAIFGGTGGTITLAGGTTTAGSITFNPFTGSYTIGTASQTLAINGGGITLNASAGAVTIQNSPITLGAAQSWTNDSSSLLTVSSGVTNGGNPLTVAGSGNATLSGAIAGSGGLTKSGAGTVMLSGVNTYSGTTIVNGGLLTSNTATSGVGLSSFGTGSITIGSSGTLQLTGSNGGSTISPFTAYYASGYTNAVSGSGTLQLVGQSGNFSVNYSGDLSGFTGTVSATAAAGTYVGFGNTSTMSLNATGSNARFVVSGSGRFLGVLGATGTIAMGELSGDGSIHASLDKATTWEIGALSTSSTFSGRINNDTSGVSAPSRWSSLRKVGTGTLTLTGSSSYSGGTRLDAGTIVGSNLNSFGSGTIGIGASGTLQLTGSNGGASGPPYSAYYTSGYTNALSGSGTLQLVGQSDNFSVNYSGDLSGFTGTVTATAAVNTWVGFGNSSTMSRNMTGSNTKFVVSGAGKFVGVLGATGTIAMGELSGNGTIYSNLNHATTWEIGALSTSSTFSGGIFNDTTGRNQKLSSLRKVGSGTLTLSGSSAYSGGTTVTDGLIVGSNRNSLGAGQVSIAASGSVRLTAGNGETGNSTPAFYGDGFTNAVSGSGVLELVGQSSIFSVNYSGDLSGFTGTVSATAAAGFFVGVGNTASEAIRLSGSNTRFVVAGAGTLLPVTGTSGATLTTIALGELSGDGGVSAKYGVDSTWQVGGLSTSSTFTGRFSDRLNGGVGRLSLVKVGSGTLALTGSQGYTGTTTISGGRLAVTGNGVLGSGSYAGAIANAGEFVFGSNVAQTLSGQISGTGSLVKAGAATLTLSANNTYAGNTTISAGTLRLAAAGSLANSGRIKDSPVNGTSSTVFRPMSDS